MPKNIKTQCYNVVYDPTMVVTYNNRGKRNTIAIQHKCKKIL